MMELKEEGLKWKRYQTWGRAKNILQIHLSLQNLKLTQIRQFKIPLDFLKKSIFVRRFIYSIFQFMFREKKEGSRDSNNDGEGSCSGHFLLSKWMFLVSTGFVRWEGLDDGYLEP
jgi:hypothetical protein